MPVLLRHRLTRSPIALEDVLSGSRLDEVLLVVPTKRRIRHLSRELLDQAQRGVAPALPIHTLESLGMALFGASPRARRLVSGSVQSLLFDAAVRSVPGPAPLLPPGREGPPPVSRHVREDHRGHPAPQGVRHRSGDARGRSRRRRRWTRGRSCSMCRQSTGVRGAAAARARLVDVEGLFSALLEEGQPDFPAALPRPLPGRQEPVARRIRRIHRPAAGVPRGIDPRAGPGHRHGVRFPARQPGAVRASGGQLPPVRRPRVPRGFGAGLAAVVDGASAPGGHERHRERALSQPVRAGPGGQEGGRRGARHRHRCQGPRPGSRAHLRADPDDWRTSGRTWT